MYFPIPNNKYQLNSMFGQFRYPFYLVSFDFIGVRQIWINRQTIYQYINKFDQPNPACYSLPQFFSNNYERESNDPNVDLPSE